MNILILTRIITNDSNSIYNSYSNGILNNYPNSTTIIDYFDLYFKHGKRKFENIILNLIQVNKIDMVFINFVSADMTFELSFIQTISKDAFLIMNFYDGELFFEPVDRYYAQCADLVLIPGSNAFTYNYKLLNINSISTLSLFDTSIYKNLNLTKDIDISFVGDFTKKSRKDFISHLTDNGYKIELFGLGTKKGRLTFNEMVNIFNRSKINLNFSDTMTNRTFDLNSNTDYSIVPKISTYIQQLKGRTIEVALCGSFTLTQSAFGIKELFNNEQIDTFKTKDELLDKIKYYLKNDQLREEKAMNAFNTATNKFDSTKQFKIILDNITLNNRKEKTLYYDNSFISNFMTYHMLYLFNFLFKFEFSNFSEEFKLIKLSKIRFNSSYNHLRQQFKFQILNKFFRSKK